MSAEHSQPSNPEFEQLTIPFEAAYSSTVTTEELNKDPLAGIPNEWLKPADNAGEVQSHDVDHKVVLKGISRVRARIQARRERNKSDASIEETDDSVENLDTEEDQIPAQPESAFAKVAREAKEGRFDGKSLKQRAQEKRAARKAKKFASSKEGRISKLEEELSGASSTIATLSGPKGKEVYTFTPRDESSHTRQGRNMYIESDEPLARRRKSVPMGEVGDNKRFVDTRNKLVEQTDEEIEAYDQKVQELNALRGYEVQVTNENIPTDMSEDDFTAFLDLLSDDQTEEIKKLISENPTIADKLENDMSNLERREFIALYIFSKYMPQDEAKRMYSELPAAVVDSLLQIGDNLEYYYKSWLSVNSKKNEAKNAIQDDNKVKQKNKRAMPKAKMHRLTQREARRIMLKQVERK